MALAVIHSRAQAGIDAPPVTVEVHLANGLPNLSIVGLPEAAVRESKDRVRSALQNTRFEFPARRITINLAPADLPKEGGRFDLPIAIGILAASGQLPHEALHRHEFLGELSLTGELRPIRGVLTAALQSRRHGRALIVPEQNADEAGLASGATVLGARHLLEVSAHLRNHNPLPVHAAAPITRTPTAPDLAEIKGQHHAKRALEIAAAGGHSLLLIGPPGAGKTMLASRLPGILPAMADQEALETASVHSVSDQDFNLKTWKQRPFRAPHHTASGVALVGGGSHPRPGEISLAHHGVLFLDELPEFDRRVLEVLREPLESGTITISRAARQAEYPARFQLVTAMNPCPCGYHGDASGRCHCTPEKVRAYRARISGPLLDRIDMQIEVPAVPRDLLLAPAAASAESSAVVRRRVERARQRQLKRSRCANSALSNRMIERLCPLNQECQQLMERAMTRFGLSARAYHRILKVVRTIADLEGSRDIAPAHLKEAIHYRCLDRELPE